MNKVHIFSCGGRGDGSGQSTSSQLFPFTAADLTRPFALAPANDKATCLFNNNGLLNPETCNPAQPSATEVRSSTLFVVDVSLTNGGALQLFTIAA